MAMFNGRQVLFSPNLPIADEHYDATSSNAQSGKAVAEAVTDKQDKFATKTTAGNLTILSLNQATNINGELYVATPDISSSGMKVANKNYVDNSMSKIAWRRIAEVEVTTSGIDALSISVDSDNQPFQLKKLRAYIYSAAGAGEYNGYIYLKSNSDTKTTSSAAIVFVKTSAQNLIFEAFANGDYPSYNRCFHGAPSPSALTVVTSFGRGNKYIVNQDYFEKFQIILNSGAFGIGTKLILEGVDAE